MQSLYRFTTVPNTCGYLPDRQWSMEYEVVVTMTAAEYLQRMLDGWRRFGHMLFHPVCEACRACRSLRVRAAEFRPDRSQRRCRAANEAAVELVIGTPAVTAEKLALYDRYHAFQTDFKGWPDHGPKDPDNYADSFVNHPFPVEEWCYYLEGRLIGVGYVDVLSVGVGGAKGQEGLSAIYFYYDPDERERGLGTWNVLCTLAEARRRRLPFVYLGYAVDGCRSMAYKTRFAPNEVRGDDGVWR